MRRPADLLRGGRDEWVGSRRGAGASSAEAREGWPLGFASRPEDREALLVLSGLPSLTAARLLDLALERKTARACLEAVLAGEAGSGRSRALAASVRPAAVRERLEAAGARTVAVHDPEYPAALHDLFDPPAVLFVRGRSLSGLAPMETPWVAIVGARNCSPVGREVAIALGRSLAAAGACVVSGGARGIDAAAHGGALQAGGPTVAVMGSGVDVPYPRENRELLDQVIARGSLVGEYPPGTPAEPFRFPARNRIVAGLARAAVVVEGAAGSGSMITAEHALDLGRDVFAVPGQVTSPLAQVPLALIREGATPIRGPDDLLEDLGLEPGPPPIARSPEGLPSGSVVQGGAAAQAVWAALTGPATVDQIAGAAGRPLAEVTAALIALEVRGLVRHVGGRYERRLFTLRPGG